MFSVTHTMNNRAFQHRASTVSNNNIDAKNQPKAKPKQQQPIVLPRRTDIGTVGNDGIVSTQAEQEEQCRFDRKLRLHAATFADYETTMSTPEVHCIMVKCLLNEGQRYQKKRFSRETTPAQAAQISVAMSLSAKNFADSGAPSSPPTSPLKKRNNSSNSKNPPLLVGAPIVATSVPQPPLLSFDSQMFKTRSTQIVESNFVWETVTVVRNPNPASNYISAAIGNYSKQADGAPPPSKKIQETTPLMTTTTVRTCTRDDYIRALSSVRDLKLFFPLPDAETHFSG